MAGDIVEPGAIYEVYVTEATNRITLLKLEMRIVLVPSQRVGVIRVVVLEYLVAINSDSYRYAEISVAACGKDKGQ